MIKYTLEEMDAFAVEAARELDENWKTWSAHALAIWWQQWYLKAGHKRLGRMLMDIAGKPRPGDLRL